MYIAQSITDNEVSGSGQEVIQYRYILFGMIETKYLQNYGLETHSGGSNNWNSVVI